MAVGNNTKHPSSEGSSIPQKDGGDRRAIAGPAPIRLIEGLVLEASRGLYQVQVAPVAGGLLRCTLRGRLRKELVYAHSANARRNVRQAGVRERDPVSAGDRVRVRLTGEGTGIVEEVVARTGGAFTRRDPQKGELTSIAGLDQLIAVFAARDPSPHLRMLDRFLVTAEAQSLAAVICLNKVDRGVEPWLEVRLRVYESIGYPVLRTSAATGEGLEVLRRYLGGRTSAFLGPSGVGKSSLLNALYPRLDLRVGDVSTATHKGRHTTTGTRLWPLDGPDGGYIADTAGLRALGLARVDLDELASYFPEFRPYLDGCPLSDCTHLHEPNCAVRTALRLGRIDAERYDSYCRIRRGGRTALSLESLDEAS
ncbi:MAG: ribosome small subunit-dependent GTPase A [Chloroflexi bacterium]|nr:ribosome small subunit-dependent GTPase A [Chloroflexota bacterium]